MRKRGFFLFFFFLLAITGFSQTQPLPSITGEYSVGTTSRYLIDTSRENPFTDDPTDRRELMVQLWYPAKADTAGQPIVYMPDADVIGPQAQAIYFPFPNELIAYYLKLLSHSKVNAPVSDAAANYPVILFSHANSSMYDQNVYQMEELASHGYIVVAIGHTYNSLSIRFTDGRVVNWDQRSTISPGIYYRHTNDVRFVLDRLTDWNQDDLQGLFTAKLDLSRVGILGMSVGGVTAARSLIYDSRFKAGINMDGTLCYKNVQGASDYTEIVDRGLDKPFMIMLHEGHVLADEHTDPHTLLRGGGYVLTIANTLHFDFSEIPMVWTLAGLPGVYPAAKSTEPLRVVRIFTDYSIAFFDRFLKRIDVPLLRGPSNQYPDVAFDIYNQFDPNLSAIPSFAAYR